MTSTLEKYALQSKSMKADRVILTDVDGVLLNWEFAFHTWMEEHGQRAAEGHEFKYCVGKRFGIDPKEGKRFINFFNQLEQNNFPIKNVKNFYYFQSVLTISYLKYGPI